MNVSQQLDRRTFLADLGHGAVALAIVGIAGCSPSVVPSLSPTAATPASTPAGGGSGLDSPTPTGGSASAPTGASNDVRWERVGLGFVSAYLLLRGGEAALVDSGVAGSEGAIEASLAALALDWSAVAHVILTHHHGDHQGSLRAVQERAPEAAAYAGAEDVPSIITGRPVTALADGDLVFDLQIVATPGHTPGSISVLEPRGGILVAGDALGTAAGRPTPPGGQFTEDMDLARQSIVKLGGLTFETLLVGHGDPIEAGASALVAELGGTF